MKQVFNNSDELAAEDALIKITALLNAAQHLTATDEEKETALELIGLAEDVAHRVMEGKA